MTKKHFIKIAKVLNKWYTVEIEFEDLLLELIKLFKEENKNFSKDKFLNEVYKK